MDGLTPTEKILVAAYLYGARDGYNTACQTFLEMVRDESIDGRDRGAVEGNLISERAARWAQEFVRQHG